MNHEEILRTMRNLADNRALVAHSKMLVVDPSKVNADEVCFWFDEDLSALEQQVFNIGHDPYNYRGPRA